MSRRLREPQLLLLGLMVSIGLHVAVLLPWLSDSAVAAEHRGSIDLATAIEPPPAEDDPEEPLLGLEDSMAKTMNWIGYDEYEEHLARLAETDQAAFELNPTAGGGAPPPQQTQQPTDPTTQPQGATAPPTVAVTQPPSPDAAQVPQAKTPTEADRIEPKAVEKPDPDAEEGLAGPPRPKPTPTEEPDPEPKPEPEQPQPKPQPQPQPEPSPQPKPDPGKGPGSGEGEPTNPADAADTESDPTSVIEVPPDTWRAGKPLAAHGLELSTKRPIFRELTMLTAQFGHPLVEIRFGRDGKPKSAEILQSSGDSRVDEPILDSLYRWRAKGEKLKELKGDKTTNIRLRIVLY